MAIALQKQRDNRGSLDLPCEHKKLGKLLT